MNQVRLHGDPFGDDAAASLLRSFLRLALGSSVRCALSLAGVTARAVEPGQRAVTLTDGVRDLQLGTWLPPAEIELLLRAANEVVAATAPVLVFAAAEIRADAVATAGWHWPRATALLPARDGSTAADLLERVRAELRWSGCEYPPHALDERELAPWLALPPVAAGGPVVTVVDDAAACGADLAIAAWRRELAATGTRLRIVVTTPDPAVAAAVREALGSDAAGADVVVGAFDPGQVRDAVAVLLPWRQVRTTRTLVLALASGRPVVAARWAATAALLATPGTCLPVGGVNVPDEPGRAAHFAPHPGALATALRSALAEPAAAMGRRARRFVGEELVRGCPSAPPPAVAAVAARPVVVLEAPLFETSSSAELTIATARALCQRGRVDVQLVPTTPLRHDHAWFRERAGDLAGRLCRRPADVDLWLSSGWPVRASRPACRSFVLRIDQEYGTLPVELTPHVTQDADAVVVHSEHVFRTVTAAGRPMASVHPIPHGVDAAMHENAPPDPAIVAWKQGRPAVLFCGGMIWRKGFDVLLGAVLAARAAGHDFGVVVKSVGRDQHYGKYHLGELLARVQATRGAPPILVLDDERTRDGLAGVYTACDVLLHPYRGEGFCLPVLEARACGLPVLATAGGATEPLLAGPGAVKIPSARRAIEVPACHVATPWVLEPSPDATAELLGAALADLPARRAAARAFAPAVRSAFNWQAAAVAIEELAFAAFGTRRGVGATIAEPVVTLPAAPGRAAERAPAPVGS